MQLWQGKYRIPSARAAWWDYANDGAYFITICTANRLHFFGECVDGQMKLSTAGAIAQGFWFEIPKHFPFVYLDAFVVMPNHVHGILVLDKTTYYNENVDVPTPVETGHCPVSTTPDTTPTPGTPIEPPNIVQNRFRNQGKQTVSSIVGSYKSVVSKHIHKAFPDLGFEWQRLFWDNIIKDHEAFAKISTYIYNNPANWQNDKFYNT